MLLVRYDGISGITHFGGSGLEISLIGWIVSDILTRQPQPQDSHFQPPSVHCSSPMSNHINDRNGHSDECVP